MRPAGHLVSPIVKSSKSYSFSEEKTREPIRDGWLYTGDYVYRDEDGYLFFVDRKKDIIRSEMGDVVS